MSYFYVTMSNGVHKDRTMRGFKNRGMALAINTENGVEIFLKIKNDPINGDTITITRNKGSVLIETKERI